MMAGIFKTCGRIYKKMQKYKELRNFTQTTLYSWPREVDPWSRMHMGHAYITRVGHLLILVDSFSGWHEVIRVPDKKSSTRKQISRNDIPKTMVTDNAPEFWDKDLSLWLKRKGCKLYKTPPYHPQSNGLAERKVQTVKMGLKACSQQKRKNTSFFFFTEVAFKLLHNTTLRKTRKPISINSKTN